MKRQVATVPFAVLAVAVGLLVVGALVVSTHAPQPTASTSPNPSDSSSATVSLSGQSGAVQGSSSSSLSATASSSSQSAAAETTTASLPAGCSPSQVPGDYLEGVGPNVSSLYKTLVVGSTSPATVCLQVYWFDPNATATFAATNLLLPPPCERAACEVLEASGGIGVTRLEANFTITASQPQLVLGGPTNDSEGAVVAYSITAKPGVSGTYQLVFQGALPVAGQFWLPDYGRVQALSIGIQGLQAPGCGPLINLVAGNGQPNYVPPPGATQGCGGPSGGKGGSIPGVSYGVPAEVMCFRIVSMTNSTQ